ncbi:hypothetical protein D3C75_904150 [compost metagenome]
MEAQFLRAITEGALFPLIVASVIVLRDASVMGTYLMPGWWCALLIESGKVSNAPPYATAARASGIEFTKAATLLGSWRMSARLQYEIKSRGAPSAGIANGLSKRSATVSD